jgi:sulfoxide reductase heme-binding subunit YedZ
MWKSPWLKRLAAALCLAPLALLAWKSWHGQLGINSIEYVSKYTGRWALRFLWITLAITPLRRLPGLNGLIGFRRMTGLSAFLYGTVHAIHYFGWDAQWNWLVIGEDLTFRRFFIAGAVALGLMIPLAVTSTDGWVRRLGGKRWQRLHYLVYPSALAAITHYVWQGKSLNPDPLFYALLLALLFAARLVIAVRKRLRHRRPNPATART